MSLFLTDVEAPQKRRRASAPVVRPCAPTGLRPRYNLTDPVVLVAWARVRDAYPPKKDGTPVTLKDVLPRGDARLFLAYLDLYDIPAPVAEWRICRERMWRADFAWPDAGLIMEVQGGYQQGRAHASVGGARNDFDKYNAAAILGLRLLLKLPADLIAPKTVEEIRQALGLTTPDLLPLYPKPNKKCATSS